LFLSAWLSLFLAGWSDPFASRPRQLCAPLIDSFIPSLCSFLAFLFLYRPAIFIDGFNIFLAAFFKASSLFYVSLISFPSFLLIPRVSVSQSDFNTFQYFTASNKNSAVKRMDISM